MWGKFKRLSPEGRLIEYLVGASWWRTIIGLATAKNNNINVQIRPKSINVYYKMQSFLRIYEQSNHKIAAEIHYKFLAGVREKPYVQLKISEDEILVGDDLDKGFSRINGNLLSDSTLRKIKDNMGLYSGEEKQIQSKLAGKNKNTLLDLEVAGWGDSENGAEEDAPEKGRIDLVNLDKHSKKIVFVELKHMFDPRLHNDEINKQLKAYGRFIKKNHDEIIDAYRRVLVVKRKLGLIEKNSFLSDAQIMGVEQKPLLVIAAYNQRLIDQLVGFGLRDKVENDACGLFFFGNSGTDLNLRKGGNKYLF